MSNSSISSIAILPQDLLLLLFSHLKWKDLPRAGLVSRLWQSIFNNSVVWERLINQHFPYLSQKSEAEYQKDPKALFIKELKHIDTYINLEASTHAATIKRFLLTALRGEVEKIDQLLVPDDAKTRLYGFALANGHAVGLKESDVIIKTEALMIAAKNNYSPAVQKILNLLGHTHFAWTSKLIVAAASGRVDEMKALMPPFSGERMALRVAAEYGQCGMIQFLLDNFVQAIPDAHKDHALNIACIFGRVGILPFLLPARGIRVAAKQTALYSAAEYGHLDVVQFLLQQVGDEYSAENKAKALCIAAKHGQFKVVQFLLAQEGITNRHKMNALLAAHQEDIVTLLSVDLSSWDASSKKSLTEQSVELSLELGGSDKGSTLVIAVQHGHLELAKALLKTEGRVISANSKMEALIEAHKQNFDELAQLLTRDLLSLHPPQDVSQQPPAPPSATLMLPSAPLPLTVTYSRKRKNDPESDQESEEKSEESSQPDLSASTPKRAKGP